MTALPLGLRSRNAISRQIGKSANAIPVMAVTGKNESKKSRERHGSGQSGHHSGRTNCRMSTLRHQPNPNAPVGPRLVGSMLTQWSRIRLRRCLQLVASSVPTSRSDIREDRDRPMAVTKTLACCLSHRSGEPLRSSLFSSAARDGHGVCELGAGHPSHQDNFGDPTFPVPAITAPVPNAPHPAVALAVRSARSCSSISASRSSGRWKDGGLRRAR